jgi:heptose-I-phosphate ethanolaminephosphotransferase
LYFALGFVEILHWVVLKGPISLTSMLVISNTNIQEVVGFINLKLSYALLVVIPYIIVFIYSLKLVPTKVSYNKISKLLIFIIALISFIFIVENAVNNRLIRKGVPQIAKVVFSFSEKIKLYNEAKKHNKPRDIIVENSSNTQKQTIVVIIGESCNRNHLGLYNYYRNTSPKLSVRNDIIVYEDVVSPYSNTLNSVLSILSESSLDSLVAVNNRIDVFDIFHSAAFKTYWLSNQSPIGVWDNMVTVFANKADNTIFVNIASNSSFEATYTKSFDEKLFQPFITALRNENDRKLIILHLMGAVIKG